MKKKKCKKCRIPPPLHLIKQALLGPVVFLAMDALVGTLKKAGGHVYLALSVAVVAEIILFATQVNLQWHWLVLYAALLVPLSPVAKDAYTFYRGNLSESDASATSFALLTTSSFISWIFAKSVQNASVLGAKFGLIGGAAYA